jgi:hypothetical protein
MSQYLFKQEVVIGDPDCVYCHAGILHTEHRHMADMDHSEFGWVIMVRDRGQDEPRRTSKIYSNHTDAVAAKYHLMATGRYNSVSVREATKEDADQTEDW